jgi:hypothetical protein
MLNKNTNLVGSEAFDPGLFQCRDYASSWTNVDDFWLRVSEVKSRKQIVESRGRLVVLFETFGPPPLFQILLELLTERGREHKRLHGRK